tara:strand:- start:73 stop:1389 length:1317 start_codon:yes stop_codon:yes gene_type:complete
MAAKMKMVMKGGKSVPAFAADGKGKMQMGGVKKYQKGGTTTKKKVDNSITGKMQRGLDYLLGSDKLRVAGTSLNNAVRPYADKTRTAMNSALRPSKSKTSMAKMQKGGSTVDYVRNKMQSGLDYILGSDKLRAKGDALNKKIKPYADKTRTALNKALRPASPKPLMAKKQYGGSSMSLGPVTDFKQIPKPAPTASSTTPAPAAAPAPTSVKEAREQARIAKINAKTAAYNSGAKVPGQNTARIIDAGVEGARLVNNVMQSRQNPDGMKKGGSTKYQNGGVITAKFKPVLKKAAVVPTPSEPSNFNKRQSRKIEKAKTRAIVASVEGYDTVSKKRSNRAENAAKVLGTSRVKVPKRVSTSNSTSNTSTKDSGNTYNTTASGAVAGAVANSSSNSAVTNGNTRAKSRPGRTGKSTSKKMQMGGPVKRGTSMMKKGGIKKK